MNIKTLLLLLLCALAQLNPIAAAGQESTRPNAPRDAALDKPNIPREAGRSYTSLDAPTNAQSAFPPGFLKFTEAEIGDVLEIYQELSNRTMVRAGNLPNVKITLRSQTRLTHREALQTLDTVLAANGFVMIPLGGQHVKAVTVAQAPMEAAPFVDAPPDQLPDSSTYIAYAIKLKTFSPQEAIHALQPFSRMPNSIVVVGDAGILLVRDYSVNVRRMIQVLDKLEAARENPGAAKP